MAQYRLQLLGSGLSRIAEIDLMMQALWGKVYSVTVLCGEGVHALNALRFGIVRTYMQHLHAQPLGKGDELGLGQIQVWFLFAQLFLGPARIVQSQTQQTLEKADQKQVYALLRQKNVVPTSFRVVVSGNLGT